MSGLGDTTHSLSLRELLAGKSSRNACHGKGYFFPCKYRCQGSTQQGHLHESRPALSTSVATCRLWLFNTWNVPGLDWDVLQIWNTLDFKVLVWRIECLISHVNWVGVELIIFWIKWVNKAYCQNYFLMFFTMSVKPPSNPVRWIWLYSYLHLTDREWASVVKWLAQGHMT